MNIEQSINENAVAVFTFMCDDIGVVEVEGLQRNLLETACVMISG